MRKCEQNKATRQVRGFENLARHLQFKTFQLFFTRKVNSVSYAHKLKASCSLEPDLGFWGCWCRLRTCHGAAPSRLLRWSWISQQRGDLECPPSSLVRPAVRAQSLNRVRLCDPMDCSPPGSSVHGILQARILERVAISSSMGSSRPRDRTHVSCTGRRFLYH